MNISSSRALKTGGEEILREHWDEAAARDEEASVNMETGAHPGRKRHLRILPDWSLCALPAGAPAAGVIPQSMAVT